jgi:hypothetical protein
MYTRSLATEAHCYEQNTTHVPVAGPSSGSIGVDSLAPTANASLETTRSHSSSLERAPTPDFIEAGFAGASPGPASRLLFTLRPVFAYKPSPRTGSGWRSMLLSAGVLGYGSNTAETVADENATVKLADVDRAVVFNRRLDGSPGVLVSIFATRVRRYNRRTEVTFEAAENLPLQLACKDDLAWVRDGDVPATTNAGLVGQLLANLPPHVTVHRVDAGAVRPVEMPRGRTHEGRWLVWLLPDGVLRRHANGHQFSFLPKEELEDVRAVWRASRFIPSRAQVGHIRMSQERP